MTRSNSFHATTRMEVEFSTEASLAAYEGERYGRRENLAQGSQLQCAFALLVCTYCVYTNILTPIRRLRM